MIYHIKNLFDKTADKQIEQYLQWRTKRWPRGDCSYECTEVIRSLLAHCKATDGRNISPEQVDSYLATIHSTYLYDKTKRCIALFLSLVNGVQSDTIGTYGITNTTTRQNAHQPAQRLQITRNKDRVQSVEKVQEHYPAVRQLLDSDSILPKRKGLKCLLSAKKVTMQSQNPYRKVRKMELCVEIDRLYKRGLSFREIAKMMQDTWNDKMNRKPGTVLAHTQVYRAYKLYLKLSTINILQQKK